VGHIEEHLGEQVCLGTLAQLARVSLHHFCRAFKQSFGVPPHQYHVQRRVEQPNCSWQTDQFRSRTSGLRLATLKRARSAWPFARILAGHRANIAGSSNRATTFVTFARASRARVKSGQMLIPGRNKA
jgi:methylphosphotriester-DNA--protein-cysteine methyltransferase